MCGACVVPVWCLCGACVVAGWFNCSLFRHSGSALNVLFAALGRSGGREGVNLALEYVVPMWCLRVWWLAFTKTCVLGGPEPYIHTVDDRMYGDFPV